MTPPQTVHIRDFAVLDGVAPAAASARPNAFWDSTGHPCRSRTSSYIDCSSAAANRPDKGSMNERTAATCGPSAARCGVPGDTATTVMDRWAEQFGQMRLVMPMTLVTVRKHVKRHVDPTRHAEPSWQPARPQRDGCRSDSAALTGMTDVLGFSREHRAMTHDGFPSIDPHTRAHTHTRKNEREEIRHPSRPAVTR